MTSSVFLAGGILLAGAVATLIFRLAGASRRATELAARMTREYRAANQALTRQITEAREASRALRESEARWRQVVETEPECVNMLGPDGVLVQVNAAGLRIFEANDVADLAGRQMLALVTPEHRASFQALTERVFQGESGTLEFEVSGLKGTRRWLALHAAPLRDEAGAVVTLLGISHDVTDRRLADVLLRWEKEALEVIVRPGALADVLDRLMRGLEANAPGALCSVLLVDDTGTRLLHGAAPSLPTQYSQAIHGVAIGPGIGSCGTAAFHNRQVIVSDIASDPLWTDFRDLALSYDLRACWSTPIRSDTGTVIGTFAIYYREPRQPNAAELVIIDRALSVVAIAVLRKQSEAALSESRERLELALQGGDLGTWEWYPQTGRTSYSTLWAQILEYAPDETVPHLDFFKGHVHPDDLPGVMERLAAHLDGRLPAYQSEHRLRTKSGAWKWVLDRGRIVAVDANGPLRVTGIIGDITERKQSESALVASQQMIAAILDTIPVRVFWKDRDLVFRGCNTAFANDAGFASPAEVVGRDDFQMGWSAQAELYRDGDRAIIASGGAKLLIEEPQTTPDGTAITLLTSKVPLRNAAGEVTGVLGTYLDISARKRAEEEVRRLAAFPEVNPNPVTELTADGVLTYANAAAAALAQGLGLADPAAMLPPKAPAIVHECLTSGKERLRVELRFGKRVLSWAFYPIAERGVVHGYAADITERLALEEQLRQSQKMEAIGQLAGGVAHDFNNILSVVMMQAEVSAASDDLPLETLDGLAQIQACAERGADLTRQLLLFSRRQVMQPKDLDLNDVVTDLAKMLKRIIGEDVSLEIHLHTSRLATRADGGMLNQVLLNLAVNARNAMPAGGRLRVETWEETVADGPGCPYPDVQPGRYVGFSVSDTGSGIPPEVLPRIFEPFFTTKEPGQGTGLGLATVFGIVRQHGGWVTVSSEPHQSTTFRILLPASDATVERRPATTRSVPRGGTETILVVEDEPSVRMLVREILEHRGYTVIEATSGLTALNAWHEHRSKVALVFTDMVMPDGVNGQELARRLREDTPGLRVVFSSGYSPDIAGRELKLGDGETFLQKPFSADVLTEVVRRALDTPPRAAA